MGEEAVKMEKAVHLVISGRVQGVFYRYTAQKVATRLGVRGWVKNLPNGRVEIIAVGNSAEIETFIAWCQEGPPGAVVTQVDLEPLPEIPETKEFSILY